MGCQYNGVLCPVGADPGYVLGPHLMQGQVAVVPGDSPGALMGQFLVDGIDGYAYMLARM